MNAAAQAWILAMEKQGVSIQRIMQALGVRKALATSAKVGPEDVAFIRAVSGALEPVGEMIGRRDIRHVIRLTKALYPKGVKMGPLAAFKAQQREAASPITMKFMSRMISRPGELETILKRMSGFGRGKVQKRLERGLEETFQG